MIDYAEMNRTKDINQPSDNRIAEAARQKVLHLGAMFGTEARITQSYRKIFFLLPEKPRVRDLKKAIKAVEESTS